MFLDRERLTNYPRIFLALYVSIAGWWLLTGPGLLDRGGKALGGDFVAFWSASWLALHGEAAAVWDLARITAVERAAIGAEVPTFAFHYPPTFLLFLAPLALLSFPWALLTWWTASVALFLAVVRRIAPHPITTGLALAYPGLFQNILQGQNGAFTTALLGGGLYLVDRRPLVGGALLGLLSYKPHLAPLVAIALLAGRRWQALAAATSAAIAAALLSLLAFGPAPWTAFRANIPFAVEVLETEGVLHWFRMPTVQVAAMMLGAPPQMARVAQLISTGLAALLVARAWGLGASLPARASVLACAAILGTPFAFDYDLAVLAIPIAFLGYDRWTHGWRRGEKALLVAAWVSPLAAPAIAAVTSVSLMPVLLLALAWTATRPLETPAPD